MSSYDFDVIIYDTCGGPFSSALEKERLLGGSELLLVQIAEALKTKGYRVLALSPHNAPATWDGYDAPIAYTHGPVTTTCHTLLISRYSPIPPGIRCDRIVVCATDMPGDGAYDHLKDHLIVASSDWHAEFFRSRGFKNVTRIYNMLGAVPPTERVLGHFVFGSGPMKGRTETIAEWMRMKSSLSLGHAALGAKLLILSPGWGPQLELSKERRDAGIEYVTPGNSEHYRKLVCSAEGLFFVNTMRETYGNVAALAYRNGVKCHILCTQGFGGLREASPSDLITDDPVEFGHQFLARYGQFADIPKNLPDRSPEAMVVGWQHALELYPFVSFAAGEHSTWAIGRGMTAMGPLDKPPSAEFIAALRADSSKLAGAVDFGLQASLGGGVFDGTVLAAFPVGMTAAAAPAAAPVGMTTTAPLRAGTHVSFYANNLPQEQPTHHYGGHARRYWVHDRILVGGSIVDIADADALRVLGITHVLSAEHEHDDAGKWPDDKRARFEFDDDGRFVSDELLKKAAAFAHEVLADPAALLYVHCRLGGSRSPSLAYLILRAAFGYAPSEAMAAIRATREEGWVPHVPYIQSIEQSLLLQKDAVAVARFVFDAYRGTPQFERVLNSAPTAPASEDKPLSAEQKFPQEDLPENRGEMPGFGTYLSLLRGAISSGGSEYGLGLLLMSLTASIRATRVVEIGRFRGFSTLALASGLALADIGWSEPSFARQRAEVDYARLLASDKKRVLLSIDNAPTKQADELLASAGLEKYVTKIDKPSSEVDLSVLGPVDLLLIDGSHELAVVRDDVARYVPHVRPGGYFVLHDYYGWFDAQGNNGSPIKRVIDEDLKDFEQLLVDTGFASFVVFRKNVELAPQPARVPPRADGRPTVGLALICKGDEGATIVARAIVSALKIVDAVTVVSDGGAQTVEVCRTLGADVYMRKTPPTNWDTGVGFIAAARNECLAIAERKTDYVLFVDPDDYYEGELPKELTADVYHLFIYDSGLRYPRPQLFKSGKGFTYTGIIHEQIVTQTQNVGRIESLKYIRGHGGHQDRNPPTVKFAQHARWLERWLIEHPDDARSQFYLGQSYRDSSQHDKAIAAYEKRIGMGGWDEERAFSACQIARILRDTGKDPTTMYLRAYELRPTRAEPLCELAAWLRDEKQKRFALAALVAKQAANLPMPEGDFLFLEPMVYQYRALEELAVALYWSGDKVGSKKCYEELIRRAPKEMKPHMQGMLMMVTREVGG